MNKTNKKFKDPGSAITHLIAMIGAVICAFPLIGKAVHTNNSIVVFAMSVFISSMILLYGASTLYHSLDISKKVNLFFRRIDHSMIFVLIAGSYTPVCLLALDRKQGIPLLVLVWATAIIGIIIKIFFINCTCLQATPCQSASQCICMAPCRRHHLHYRRYYLRIKASDF